MSRFVNFFRRLFAILAHSAVRPLQNTNEGLIAEHIQAGKNTTRRDPIYREGQPKKYLPSQIAHAPELLQAGKTYRQVEAMTGISKSTLVRTKKDA